MTETPSPGFVHHTVLLEETVEVLAPAEGRVIVDCTLGGGGHSEALLERGARVVALDQDPVALRAARARLAKFSATFEARQGNFALIEDRMSDVVPVMGVLADLGVSSPQLDEAARGFSFQQEGPLDMRMGDEGQTAAELLASTEEGELADLIFALGDERFSRPIARELKAALPQTTFAAVEAVKKAVPRRAWPEKIHVATRTFQALRMAVNQELESLDALLAALPRVLAVGGRAAIITFHSLEDRKVKEAFRTLAGRCTCPPGLPVCGCGGEGDFVVLTKKAISASDAEIARNPRARSAHLRAVEKIR